MGLWARLHMGLLEQRGALFPWLPVFLGIGIGVFFGLRFEPPVWFYWVVGGLGGLGALVALRRPGGLGDLGWALAFLCAGFCLAGWRSVAVAGPVIDFRYYGAIEGRIVGIDRSASDAPRVTLDRVYLERTSPERTPTRVRVSFHGPVPDLEPGARIMLTGHLSPPQGPVEPGGFDFRRHSWFLSLGAVGYSRTPVLLVSRPDTAGLRVFGIRMALSDYIRSVLPGDAGAFAAAVTTGDRSAMSEAALEALRASNTAHLLAISGLHMGLLAGFVFAVLRGGMALAPRLALRLPAKKMAAVGAIVAGAAYLALSGGNVATERAFVMASVVLVAVLLERRALSLRSVALAAMIVLALRPEALLGPGFQMSFAATTALIAVFGVLRESTLAEKLRLPVWLRPVMGVVISSAVAGLATAPIGAAHFNALSHYGLLANLVAVPIMGAVIVPAAVVAACLAPLGLDFLALKVMGLALELVLAVAHFVAGLEGARSFVPSPAPAVLPLLCLGMLFLILWQGRWRLAGLVPVVAAFVLWAGVERPALLIADNGSLLGAMTGDGRALSKARGSGFIAQTWLENDGERTAQDRAAARWPGDGGGKLRRIRVDGVEYLHAIGKGGVAELRGCGADQVIVASVPLRLDGPCRVYDPARLRQTGSLAVTRRGLVTARELSGTRRWHERPKRRPFRTAAR